MFRRMLAVLACVGGCGENRTQAPDAPTAETCYPGGSITTYPGSYVGTVNGQAGDLSVAMGTCTSEVRDLWFDHVGEDTVIALGGLTIGATYAVMLDTIEDLGFYVLDACPTSSGIATSCSLFADANYGGEIGTFVATAVEHFVVVDSEHEPMALTTGMFELHVVLTECVDDAGCTTSDLPACENFVCTECHNTFDCTSAAAPACTRDNMCVAGPMQCTGDDEREAGNGDDGPVTATVLAPPTLDTPTTITGAVCNTPTHEGDWYSLTLTATESVGLTVEFSRTANDVDVGVYDATGSLVASGLNDAGISEQLWLDKLGAGTYYIYIQQYVPANTTAAVPYTLTLSAPECTTMYGCTTADAPVCGAVRTCGAGPSACTGDDDADSASGDDGPAAARDLTGTVGVATTLSGAVCNAPFSERDFYKVAVDPGEGIVAKLAWATSEDLDLRVFDSQGRLVGLTFWMNPEIVTLTYLPAGTYYLEVVRYATIASAAAVAYTIEATRTPAQTCTTASDCAAEYSTQVYRGSCSAGACSFIAVSAGAAGAPCDSRSDCATWRCSYVGFEADAQESVCTTLCTTTDDCAGITGTTCTAGLTNNFCVPSCTSDLDCGAKINDSRLTPGQPWAYGTCDGGSGVCTY